MNEARDEGCVCVSITVKKEDSVSHTSIVSYTVVFSTSTDDNNDHNDYNNNYNNNYKNNNNYINIIHNTPLHLDDLLQIRLP
jgi:hypothetical protein